MELEDNDPETDQHLVVDRAYDEGVFNDEAFALTRLQDPTMLLESWLRLQRSKSESELKAPEWRALEAAYMKHLEWRFAYPSKVLQQQLVFAWFVTGLVTLLILAGLAFAFLQLRAGLAVAEFASMETELAIQAAGNLSYRSSLVGASVLVVSLIFFYLSLRYVFTGKSVTPPHIALTETDAPALYGKVLPRRRRASQHRRASGRKSANLPAGPRRNP